MTRRILKITGIVFISIILTLVISVFLLSTSRVQMFVVNGVSESLSEEFNTNISVGKFRYLLFNTIRIDDVYIEDLDEDVLAAVDHVDLEFRFWPLFLRKVEIAHITIAGLEGNLKTDKDGVHNFEFLLRPKKEKREKRPFNLLMKAPNIVLDSANVRYQRMGNDAQTDGRFSANDIKVENLCGELALNYLSSDSLNAEIKSLSLTEQSGIDLKDIRAKLIANRQIALIPEVSIEVGESRFSTEHISIAYDKVTGTGQWMNEIVWDVPQTALHLALADLTPFVPEMRTMEGVTDFSGRLTGTIGELQIEDLVLDYNQLPLMRGMAEFSGLPDIEETFVYADVSALGINKARLQDLISDFKNEPFLLPHTFDRLGDVRFTGNITGFLGNLVAFGALRTDIGVISTDLLLESDFEQGDIMYSGEISTSNFGLGKLLGNNTMGDITFSLETEGKTTRATKSIDGQLDANVKMFEFKDYMYRNLRAEGEYNSGGFDGKFEIRDENLSCAFAGLVDFTQDVPVMNFNLALDTLRPHELNLTEKYEGSELRLNTTINIVGNSPDNLNGYVVIDSLKFENNDEVLRMDAFTLMSDMNSKSKNVSIRSDFLNAQVAGNYKFSTLTSTLGRHLANYLPSTLPSKIQKKYAKSTVKNDLEFDIYVKNLDSIGRVMGWPVKVPETSIVKGVIDDSNDLFDLQIGVPRVEANKVSLDDFTFRLNNDEEGVNLAAFTKLGKSKRKTDWYIRLNGANDTISSALSWRNNDSVINSGHIDLYTSIAKTNDKPTISTRVNPSFIVINDSVWHLSDSKITVTPEREIEIDDFRFASNAQYINISGVAGKDQSDSIYVDMMNLQLDYFLNLIPSMNDKNVSFGGHATGVGYIYSALDAPLFDAALQVADGSINDVVIGNLDAAAQWDRENEQIVIGGELEKDSVITAYANGVLIPKLDSVLFVFDGQGLNLSFIDRYTKDFLKDIQGDVYGQIRMFGNMKEKRTHFAGKALVRNGSVGIEELNTRYYFTDSVTMTKEQIILNEVDVTDSEGNLGELNGLISHNGTFDDFKYDINIDCKNIIGLNTKIEDNDSFFGKVYATGNVKIKGDEAETVINVKAKTEANSDFSISLAGASDAADNTFITFVEPTNIFDTTDEDKKDKTDDDDGSRLRIILQIEATPEATMQVIIDPKTGDVVTGYGAGSVRFELTPEGEMKLLGTYTLESGLYTFTLQNMIRRDFRIVAGSTVSWIGDPVNAQIDIQALYNTTASLKDLQDEDLLSATSRTNVPVNCVLNLSGELLRPNLKFDLNLPNSDEAIKERVKNIISTDEMMNRQIIYLLVFSKFYTPEYLQTSTANVGTNEAYSLLTSTVTSQINNWISQLTTDFSFGFNIRAFDYEGQGASQEYETEFLYQPNNRLAINGNLGYRNDDISDQKVFGDIDIEYMLDRAGKIRAKAYTHSVDRYKYLTDENKQTMQGVGVVYKEEFNTIRELMYDYKERFKNLFKKKDKKKKGKKKGKDESK